MEREPPANAIRARGLTRQFASRRAVDGIDLDVPRGQALALFGPNGAGKSTLIQLLTLQLRPTRGSFTIDGLEPRRDGVALRRRLGVLSHQSFLYDDLTAAENLEFFARLYGVDDPRSRCRELLDLVDLGNRGDDRVGSFSRGMQQRVALARALVHDPAILFLDEPFTGLDPDASRKLCATLNRLRGDARTLLLVSHDLAQGIELSDRWIILRSGRIAADGVSAETDAASFESVYFDSLRRARA